MAEKKEKRYVSDNAQLMAEWDWEKNKVLGFEPNEVTFGSIKKIWWICDKGHEWQATPNNRSNGQGCIGISDVLAESVSKGNLISRYEKKEKQINKKIEKFIESYTAE